MLQPCTTSATHSHKLLHSIVSFLPLPATLSCRLVCRCWNNMLLLSSTGANTDMDTVRLSCGDVLSTLDLSLLSSPLLLSRLSGKETPIRLWNWDPLCDRLDGTRLDSSQWRLPLLGRQSSHIIPIVPSPLLSSPLLSQRLQSNISWGNRHALRLSTFSIPVLCVDDHVGVMRVRPAADGHELICSNQNNKSNTSISYTYIQKTDFRYHGAAQCIPPIKGAILGHDWLAGDRLLLVCLDRIALLKPSNGLESQQVELPMDTRCSDSKVSTHVSPCGCVCVVCIAPASPLSSPLLSSLHIVDTRGDTTTLTSYHRDHIIAAVDVIAPADGSPLQIYCGVGSVISVFSPSLHPGKLSSIATFRRKGFPAAATVTCLKADSAFLIAGYSDGCLCVWQHRLHSHSPYVKLGDYWCSTASFGPVDVIDSNMGVIVTSHADCLPVFPLPSLLLCSWEAVPLIRLQWGSTLAVRSLFVTTFAIGVMLEDGSGVEIRTASGFIGRTERLTTQDVRLPISASPVTLTQQSHTPDASLMFWPRTSTP
jgi:hypothetical protein